MATPFLSSEEYDEQAFELYEAGEYDAAIDLLRTGLAVYPTAADLHVGLGYVRAAREEFPWAITCFRQAVTLDPQHEDGWVGLGESLLRLDRKEEACACFAQVDILGFGDDLEFGMTIGRALYREGLLEEARDRFEMVLCRHPTSEDALVGLAYACYAAGDDERAERLLREVLERAPDLHDARVQLSHIRHEAGDFESALAELRRIPVDEMWDGYALWRFVELRKEVDGVSADDPSLRPLQDRLALLEAAVDPIDELLAEVESAAAIAEEGAGADTSPPGGWDMVDTAGSRHRIRTVDGRIFTGTWEEIVVRMRDAMSGPDEPIDVFMRKTAHQARALTGRDLPCDDPERFLRESARIGLLSIEREEG